MTMKPKALFVGAMLAWAGLVAAATDPVVGSWQLNVAKSTFAPGRELKSETRVYRETTDGMSVEITGETAKGTALSQQSTFKVDGKTYPWSGSADYDSLSVKRINGSTITTTLWKGGKAVGHSVRTVSKHGKMLTLTTRAMSADGKRFSQTLVFDRQ
jgi:hypothetical protein